VAGKGQAGGDVVDRLPVVSPELEHHQVLRGRAARSAPATDGRNGSPNPGPHTARSTAAHPAAGAQVDPSRGTPHRLRPDNSRVRCCVKGHISGRDTVTPALSRPIRIHSRCSAGPRRARVASSDLDQSPIGASHEEQSMTTTDQPGQHAEPSAVEVAVCRLTAPCGRCLGDRRVDLDLLCAHRLRGAEGRRVGHGPGEGKSEGPSRLDGGDEPKGNRSTAFVAGGVDEGHRPLDPLEHRYVAGPPDRENPEG